MVMSRKHITRLLSRTWRQHEGNKRSVLKTGDLLVESWKHGERIRDEVQGARHVVGCTRNESVGRASEYVPNPSTKVSAYSHGGYHDLPVDLNLRSS